MISNSFISKLPLYFRNNPSYLKIAQLFSKSSIRYSSQFVQSGNDLHIMLKDGTVHIPEDWASSKMMINTGQSLRQQLNLYESRQGYGNKNVDDLNSALLGQERQKIFFLTKKMSIEEIKTRVNEKYYEVINIGEYEYDSIYDAFAKIMEMDHKPVVFETGLNVIHQYFAEVAKGKLNHLDTILISKYSGEIDKRLLGSKLQVPLEKYYDMKWKSQDIPCAISNNQKGILNFEIYISRNQPK